MGRQTFKPTLQDSSQIPHGDWGVAASRVELLIGSPHESAALALHIASGNVQNAFHHMGIPECLRPYFCLKLASVRAFGMTGKVLQFLGACSFVSMSLSTRRSVQSSLSLPVLTDGGLPVVVGANHSVWCSLELHLDRSVP